MKVLASCIAAAIAASSVSAAWTISSSDATRSEDVVGPHQEYSKTWTVTGSESLASLRLAGAGPVFVDVDASLAPAPATDIPATTESVSVATETSSGSGSGALRSLPVLSASVTDKVVAKIVFSGNCTDLLDVFQVVHGDDGRVKIHFKNQDYEGYGYVLTQVFVAEQSALTSVAVSGTTDVYVGENVVASSGNATDVSFSISGVGVVFVTAPSTDFTIKSLGLKVSGDGTIQVNASSLSVSDALASKISGDGTIAVVATNAVSVNNSLATSISGEGSVYVQAAEVTTFALATKISGEGYVAVSRNGSCVAQDISISGEGTVHTGSITCVDTKLRLSGEGNVLVQTTNTLKVPSYIDGGKVQYVGAAPQSITDGRPLQPKKHKHKHHGFWWWGGDDEDNEDSSEDDSSEDDDEHRLPKSVTQVSENTFKVYESAPVPAREPVFIALSIRQNWWWEDPNTHSIFIIGGEDIDIGSTTMVQSMAVAAKKHVASHAVGYASVAGVALVAVSVAMHKMVARRRRRDYQPLLHVTTARN